MTSPTFLDHLHVDRRHHPRWALPILRVGVVPVEQTPPATIPAGYIPVATVSLYECDCFSGIDQCQFQDLARRSLLPHVGNPDHSLDCLVDLETAVRAAVIWGRGTKLEWTDAAVCERIRNPDGDDYKLRRVMERFLRGYQWSAGDHGCTVGFRPDINGSAHEGLFGPVPGRFEILDYMAGL
jgi:hypothetical protein